jgi:hypothetical protein
LFFVTMFISMWISNTAATAMMIPIMETVLMELEAVSFRFPRRNSPSSFAITNHFFKSQREIISWIHLYSKDSETCSFKMIQARSRSKVVKREYHLLLILVSRVPDSFDIWYQISNMAISEWIWMILFTYTFILLLLIFADIFQHH